MNQQQQPDTSAFQWALAQFLIRHAARTVQVFLRHGFGERYLSFFGINGPYRAFLWFLILTVFYRVNSPGWTPDGRSLFLFLLVYTAMLSLHQFWSRNLRRRGHLTHSYFTGYSFGFWRYVPASPNVVRVVLEPLFAFVINSVIVMRFNPVVGLWIHFAIMCSFFVGLFDAAREKRIILDSLDSQFEAQNLSSHLTNTTHGPSQEVHEAFRPPPPSRATARTESVEDAVRNLDPALRDLMKGK